MLLVARLGARTLKVPMTRLEDVKVYKSKVNRLNKHSCPLTGPIRRGDFTQTMIVSIAQIAVGVEVAVQVEIPDLTPSALAVEVAQFHP